MFNRKIKDVDDRLLALAQLFYVHVQDYGDFTRRESFASEKLPALMKRIQQLEVDNIILGKFLEQGLKRPKK